MAAPSFGKTQEARRWRQRRAFSLFELLAVVTVLGVVASMAVMKFGHDAYGTANAEGLVRRLALDISQARRRAIATGDDHYLQFNRVSGAVAGYALFRDASGGDYQVDDTIAVPAGATVTTSADTWTYDFSGALTTSGTSSVIRVDDANFYWNLTVYHATGATSVDRQAQP